MCHNAAAAAAAAAVVVVIRLTTTSRTDYVVSGSFDYLKKNKVVAFILIRIEKILNQLRIKIGPFGRL